MGYALRATVLLVQGRIAELNVEFHPKSAKEELKEELDDLEHRQAAGTAIQSSAVPSTEVLK